MTSLGDLPGGIFESIAYDVSTNGEIVVGYSITDIGIEAFFITTGTFQAEADVNQDNVVNLLDVAPFVALLSGWITN